MRAVRFCLSVVRRGGDVATPAMGTDVDQVSAFLVAHATRLREGAAPCATFLDSAKERRFEVLRDGTDNEFRTTAAELTGDLVREMSHVHSTDGVLVCVTFEHDDGMRSSAALKLQVVNDHGAVLQQLETGETVLSAVEDVLERPGELQKGISFPDQRPESDAVVGDKASRREARYFLTAMGVRAQENPTRANAELARLLIDAVAPAQGTTALRQLTSATPGPVAQVVQAATLDVELLRDREELISELTTRDRPVRDVDTTAPLRVTYEAGDVKVSVPATAVERVTVERVVEGGWQITVRVDVEPHRSIRS